MVQPYTPFRVFLAVLAGWLLASILGLALLVAWDRYAAAEHQHGEGARLAAALAAAPDAPARSLMLQAFVAALPIYREAQLRHQEEIIARAGGAPASTPPPAWFQQFLTRSGAAGPITTDSPAGDHTLRLVRNPDSVQQYIWRLWLQGSVLLAALFFLLLLPLDLIRTRRIHRRLAASQRTLERVRTIAADTGLHPGRPQEPEPGPGKSAGDSPGDVREQLRDAVFTTDTGLHIDSWSTAAERLLGYPAAEVLGQPVAQLIPAWRQAELESKLEQAAGGAVLDNELTQLLDHNGRILQVLCTLLPADPSGDAVPGGCVVSVRDISGLHARELPRRLRAAAVRAAGTALIILDAYGEFQVVEANPAAGRLLAEEPELLAGEPLVEILAGGPNAGNRESLESCLRTGGCRELRLSYQREETSPPLQLRLALTPLTGASVDTGHLLVELADETGLMATEERLRAREAQLEGMVGAAPIGMVLTDAGGQLQSANPAFCTLLGRPIGDLAGISLQEFLEEDCQELLAGAVENPQRSRELHLHRASGERLTVLASLSPMVEVKPTPGFVLFVMDISARKRAEQSLYQEIERATVTLEAIADAVITTSELGVVEYLNPAAEKLTGWSSLDAQGLDLNEVLHLVNEISGEPEQDPVERCLRLGRRIELTDYTLLLRGDGHELAVQLSASPIHDRSGRTTGSVLVLREVTAIRQQVRRMSYEARHDPLTGLYNRREFELRLADAVERAREERKYAVLCYLDLDNFKNVNDSGGHIAGDELLKQVASLLRERVRDADVIARLGGDEFALLLQGCSLERGTEVAEGLCSAIQAYRFAWKDTRFDIGVSIGLVALNESSTSVESVLKAADTACYEAKESGRNTVRVYTPGPDDGGDGEVRSLKRLLQAVERDRLVLFRQPLRSLSADETRSMNEILVRLADDQGRLLNPRSFLPAAVRYERMAEVDRWVIGTLFSHLGQNRGEGTESDLLFVNLSAQSIGDEGFLQFIVDQAGRNNLHPGQICLELDESDLLTAYTRIMRFMSALQEKGFQFALDDFGSSLTPFSYLKGLPVSYLKFGRQVITDLAASPVDQSILRAMTGVARQMGIRTVAKQLEDESLVPLLTELGVDYIQGYAVAAPVPLRGTGTTVPVPNGLESGSES